MAKRVGRKPAKDSDLPDPKVWKWCKHPECTDKFLEPEDFSNEQKFMRMNSEVCAVFLEDYCWNHLSEEARSNYKAKIEKWVNEGYTLQEAKLESANLQEADLGGANLQKAWLVEANLQEVHLWTANLQEAYLAGANLQKAYLRDANFQKAGLAGADLREAYLEVANLQEAYLKGANLQEADLTEAKLQGADLSLAQLQKAVLLKANLQKANLKDATLHEANFSNSNLHGCYMHGVLLDDARYLTWQQIEYTGEEKGKKWLDAQDAYRRLKNYFHQQGRYQDESKAYYREKLMAKHLAHEELFGRRKPKGIKRAFQNIGSFFKHNENKGVRKRWFGLWFMWALSGFGERWSRTICWAAGTFAFFGLLHWLGTNAKWWVLKTHGGEVKSLLDCLYFSLVTFVTLGFGDIWPDVWLAKVIVGVEVVFGYVFLGLIVTLIARKMGR
ncbi:hypothetical protein ES703_23405 [subsurface metagenome]|nr:hypothetical protein [bacterium]